MSAKARDDITHLLLAWGEGDQEALAELMPRVYAELHRLGRQLMRREGARHTLQPTALIHEAYLRLVDQRRVRWQSRAHFFAIAATLMRRVLMHHAERKHAQKRGGKSEPLPLDLISDLSDRQSADLLALDDALRALEGLDPRQSRIVQLRFFGGFEVKEVAELLAISPATVKREWRMARAWLQREIRVTRGELAPAQSGLTQALYGG